VAPGTVTLIVSCVICAAFRGLILSGSLEQVNIAVGAAQYNVQYWCASCDAVLRVTQLATVQCAVGNVIVLYVLQSLIYTHMSSLEGCVWVPVLTTMCLYAVCSEFVRCGTARGVPVVCGVQSRSVEL
jgi:hypothetical protein